MDKKYQVKYQKENNGEMVGSLIWINLELKEMVRSKKKKKEDDYGDCGEDIDDIQKNRKNKIENGGIIK